jgi:hypothetical protein
MEKANYLKLKFTLIKINILKRKEIFDSEYTQCNCHDQSLETLGTVSI